MRDQMLLLMLTIFYGVALFAGAAVGWVLNKAAGKRLMSPWALGGLGLIGAAVFNASILVSGGKLANLSPVAQGRIVGEFIVGPAFFPIIAAWCIGYLIKRSSASQQPSLRR